MEFAGSSSLSSRPDLISLALPPLVINPVAPVLSPAVGLTRPASSLVFVDASVPDYQSLLMGVQLSTEVHVLDSTDAIAQITQTLLGRTGISSVQILSHGAAGGLQLGQDWVTIASLDRHASEIQSWAQALAPGADLLLLGCDVGQGVVGQTFMQRLSQLTGADIAASTNLTGSADWGGDWNLEVNTGQIETAIAFQASALASYHGILAAVDLISQVPNSAGNNLVSDAVGVNPTSTSISGDGNYIVFSSKADNLVPSDANGNEDVFLYDRILNTTTLISHALAGGSGNGTSSNAVISRDGNYVAFSSTASDLVTAGLDLNNSKDIFVWNRGTSFVTLVSQGINGVGNGASDNAVITNDGSRIAFVSEATNLTTITDNNNSTDIFIRDWQAAAPLTMVASLSSAGQLGSKGSSNVSISGDGLYVAFSSNAPNLVTNDLNAVQDVFIHGLIPVNPAATNPFADKTILISRSDSSATSVFGNGASANAVISNDGTFVAFVSNASNLVENNVTNLGLVDDNTAPDVFVRNWALGRTVLVSINSAKTGVGNNGGGSGFGAIAGSGNPVISFDGKYIAFTSYSSDLVANDANATQDVFVRDWSAAASVTTLVSRVDFPAGSANGSSFAPVISSDGEYIAFMTDASNAVSSQTPDTNTVRDVVLWKRSDDTTQIVSRNTAGNSGDAASYNPVIATDVNGVYVGFVSDASNLQDPSDLNGQPDLFVRNVNGSITTLVSRRDATLPTPITGLGASSSSAGNSVSADGRYVVFTSTVSNFVNNDSNSIVQDVFWRDRQTGLTRLVSRSQSGFGSGNQSSSTPIISSDGRYVAFTSNATNLVTGDTNGKQDIFVWDSNDNSMILVSRTSAGQGGNGDATAPVMSSDGRYIAFVSVASDLTASDTNNAQDVFIWDRTLNAVALVSRDISGAAGNNKSLNPTISNDGSVVAFESDATNLIATDTNSASDVFGWQRGADITTGTVQVVSRSTAGAIGNGASINAAVSGDGKYVAFVSTASNFAIADTNGKQDVFVNELLTGKTDLVSINTTGTGSGSTSGATEGFGSANPVINNNGQYIAFVSDAVDLVTNDNNQVKDVYVWNRATGKNLLVSVNKDGTGSGNNFTPNLFFTNGGSTNPVISGDGQLVGFTSYSSDLVANDTNGQQDVFVRSLAKTNVTLVSRSPAGVPSNNDSTIPVLSSDGTYLVFTSNGSNLVTGDFNSNSDVFGDTVSVMLPTVTVGTFLPSGLEGNDPTTPTPYNFEVILSKVSADTVTVPFSLTDVTTTAGTDYVIPPTTTLTFAPGQTRQTIAVGIKGDTIPELDETFTLTLGTPGNATLGAIVTATGTILNDDKPVISFSAPSVSISEGNTGKQDVNFIVTLSQPNPQVVTVNYSTADGNSPTLSNNASAAASDYDAIAAGTLTFAANTTIQTITVKVNGDTKFEANENFLLTLATPTNATLAATTTATGTITNDDTAPTVSIADVSLNEGNSGTTDFPFVVTLSQAIEQDIVVNYTTVDGTGTVVGNDYVGNTGTLTFAAGTTANTITVKVNGDTSLESNETFTVQLSNATAGATPLTLAKGTATGTILNDELPALNFSAPTFSVVEGNSGKQDLNFIVTLSQATAQPVTVTYNTTDGAAAISSNNARVADNDYDLTAGTLTFAANTTQQTITVKVNGDTKFEPDQSFALTLAAPTNAILGATAIATGTITTDDLVPPTLSIADVSLNEGNTGTTDFPFVVTLAQAIDQDVVVNYATVDGTATVTGSDYVSNTGTLTIAAGNTANTVIVKVNGDTIVEANESFTVQLSNATVGATPLTLTKGTATGTILNDEVTVNFSTPTFSVVEGNSGKKDLNFIVTLSQATTQPVTVAYATADGAAAISSNNAKVGNSDYDALTGTLTFAANTTIQTVTVKVNGDTIFEPDQSFTLALSAPTNASLGTTAIATGTITNDDAAPTLSIADVSLNEGNSGTTDFPFVVTLSQAIEQDVVVNYVTVDGSGTVVGNDYISNTGTLTFAAGSTANTITVKVNGDTILESNETFTVQLSNATVGATPLTLTKGTATGTILNDELPALNFANAAFSVVEGNTGKQDLNFIVTLSQATAQPVTATYTTVDGTAAISSNNARVADNDYDAVTGTVTFAANTTRQTITVKVNGDAKFEPDQSFTLGLSAPSNAALGTTITATGTITNDDVAPTLSIANGTVIEGNSGTVDLPFVVTLAQAIEQDAVVNYATVDGSGTATVNTDYAKTTSALTITAGATTSTAIVKVNGETAPELNETFTTQLTSAAIGATALTFTQANATGTILNDDTVVSFSQPTFTIAEGNSGKKDLNFVATLAQPSAVPVTVNYSTANGTAVSTSDYDNLTGVITFAPNTTVQTIAIKVNGDPQFEADESFTLTLATPNNATLGTTVTATGTITNDDALIVPTITIAPVVASQSEGSGTTSFDFTVKLSQAIDQPITMVYDTADNTAKAGSDYVALTNRTLTFAPGEISKLISVDVMGDSVYELDETFKVNLSNPSGATLATSSATGTIANDDSVPFLIFNGVGQAEGNTGTTGLDFNFSLSNASYQPITLNYTTVDGTAKVSDNDYQAASGTLTFAPGTTTQKVTVNIIGDTQFEPSEKFSLQISNPTGNVVLANTSATATINNDDGAPTLNFGQATVAQSEGNSGTTDFLFTVVLTPANTQQNVTVNYATTDGAALVSDSDYQSASGVVTFSPGETVKTIAVKVNGDTKVELDEIFAITLSGASNAVLGSVNSAIGTIVNDDTAPDPTVTIAPVSKLEGNTGTTDFPFVVTLSQASDQPLVYNYTTTDGTANAGLDYTATTGLLTFTPGQTSQTITIKVIGDTVPESDETFKLALTKASDPFNTVLANATGTIGNDDGQTASPTISVNPLSADKVEGNSSTTDFTFAVTLSQVSSQPVTVVYRTADGSATIANLDYQAIGNTTLTFAPGETSKVLTVKVNGDTQFEPDETFTVNLVSPTNATIATTSAIGTIRNDDAAPNLPTISINPLSANKTEGNTGTTDFTFAVTLSQSSAQAATVVYNTADGTARVGDLDYQAANGVLTFAAGQTSQILTVKVNGDTQVESDESFTVNLSGGTGATIAAAAAAGIIVNDDANFGGGGGATTSSRNQDIIWRNSRTGENGIWLMNNTPVSNTATIQTVSDLNWAIVDNVDINRDGNLDIVWRNYQTGENGIWFMQNSTLKSSVNFLTVADINWRIESVTDFNGDGKYDFLWRNNRTGENAIWLMDGNILLGSQTLPSLADVNWTIAGVGDFNTDNQPDILWRNYRTGENAIWALNGGNFVKGNYLPSLTDISWTASLVADFNHDRTTDILWRNYRTGQNAIWFIANGVDISGVYLPPINDGNVVPESVIDLNNDRTPEILWRNYRTGENFLWYVDNGVFGTSISLPTVIDRNWIIEKTGDYNSDRIPDILWRNSRTGEVANWFLNGTTIGQTLLIRPEPGLRTTIVASGDFDGDGYTDIILRDALTGKNTLWLMRDTNYLSAITLPDVVDLNTTVVGVADFNGNGSLDLLWNNNRSGETFIWQMNGPTFGSRIDLPRPKELDAVIAGLGDFNGDKSVDILWQSLRTSETFLWLMNGVNQSSVISYGLTGDPQWKIAGVGDFDNDQNPDMLWHNSRTGETGIWLMKGTALNRVANLFTVPDVDWTIAGVGEFNGDKNLDILWRNIRTGDTAIWYMNGSTFGVGVYGYQVSDLDWQIQGINEFNRARG